jgi:hypothetical protein
LSLQERHWALRVLVIRPAFQHLQVLGDGGQAHLAQERLGQIGNIGLAARQPRQHGTAGRVGKGGKSPAELVLH